MALDYSCNVYEGGDCKLAMVTTRISWDQAFSCVAPLMLNPASEPVMQKALEDFIGRKALGDVQQDFPVPMRCATWCWLPMRSTRSRSICGRLA